MIVIEGMDNSGKSTLALAISRFTGLPIQESEGPPKSRGEINERIKRYFENPEFIFVRHPCVSNPIYDEVRPAEERGWVWDSHLLQFYRRRPLFIYCDPLDRGMTAHIAKDHDSPEHLERINSQYAMLLAHYRGWAIQSANLIYRIGDNTDRIIWAVSNEH